MNSIRYIPHTVNTRFYACKLYNSGNYSVLDVCRKYHISKASLMRWMQRFDGSKDSLLDKSKTPLSAHPNSHTSEEISNISKLIKRNPNISMLELYGKLKRNYNYSRHPASLFRFLRKHNILFKASPIKKKPKKHNQPYDTPTLIGLKWQIDVKYVPKHCKVDSLPKDIKYYQYTVIDEASRERFLYWYDEKSMSNSIDFIARAFNYFKYQPLLIQSDNGSEFTYPKKVNKIHPFTQFLESLKITHKTIRVRTPQHNGKVERSHRNDNERFYQFITFYSLEDLNRQGKQYLRRSNNIPMATLGYLTPNEVKALQLK